MDCLFPLHYAAEVSLPKELYQFYLNFRPILWFSSQKERSKKTDSMPELRQTWPCKYLHYLSSMNHMLSEKINKQFMRIASCPHCWNIVFEASKGWWDVYWLAITARRFLSKRLLFRYETEDWERWIIRDFAPGDFIDFGYLINDSKILFTQT